MNADPRARAIERAALRAANRAMERNPGAPLSREDLLGLRIQAAPLGARIILAVLGLAAFGAGLGLGISHSWSVSVIVLLITGFFVFIIGLVGWKRTLLASLDSLGTAAVEGVLNALIHGLGHL